MVNTPAINAGDIDVRWFGVLDQWDNGTLQVLLSQWGTLTPERSWIIGVHTTGALFYASTNGTAQTNTSQHPLPFANGQAGGIRFTRVKSTGVTTCWLSTDGVVWTAQGTTTVIYAGLSLFASDQGYCIGSHTEGLVAGMIGKTYWAEARSGINGTIAWRFGPESLRHVQRDEFDWVGEMGTHVQRRGGTGIMLYPSVYTPLEIYNGSTSGTRVWPKDDGYASFFDWTGNYIVTPSKARIDADLKPGFTLVAKIRRHAAPWVGGQVVACKNKFWTFDLDVTGWGEPEIRPRMVYEFNNHTEWSWTWGNPLPETNNWLWLAFCYIENNGTGNKEMRFGHSFNGTTWTYTAKNVSPVLTGGMSPAPTENLYIGANPWAPVWSNLDIGRFSIRKGTGPDCTVAASPGTNETFLMDRSSFSVARRATTLATSQGDVLTITRVTPGNTKPMVIHPTV